MFRLTFIGGAIIASIVAAFALNANHSHRRKAEDLRLVRSVWSLIKDNYYDSNYNGYNWARVGDTYAEMVSGKQNRTSLYQDIIGPMVGLMESSHLQVVQPGSKSEQPRTYISIGSTYISCFGFYLTSLQPGKRARVNSVRRGSRAELLGIRQGWAITEVDSSVPGRMSVKFVTQGGKSIKVILSVRDRPILSPRNTSREADTISLGSALRRLGIGLSRPTVGKLPAVANIAPYSLISKVGVPEGAEVSSLSYTHGPLSSTIQVSWRFGSQVAQTTTLESACKDWKAQKPSVSVRSADGVTVIRADRFNQEFLRKLIVVLSSLSAEDSLILDLRSNSGGDVAILQSIAGTFLGPDVLLGYVKKQRSSKALLTTDRSLYEGKVGLLVGPTSASSAEVISAALDHYGRSKSFGTTTAGEALVARTYRLSDNGLIQIPVANYLRINSLPIEEKGYVPSFLVKNSSSSLALGHDCVLIKATQWLQSQKKQIGNTAGVANLPSTNLCS